MKPFVYMGMLWMAALSARAATVAVRIEPVGGTKWTTDSGQTVTVTRLAFLLSDFRLQTEYGPWIALPEQFAFVDAVSAFLPSVAGFGMRC